MQNPERAEARRREILIAAARVFARDGYAAATLDDLAREVGVTKGVMYYHFRSKEERYTEIRSTAIGEAVIRLEAIMARGAPPAEALHAVVRDLVSHIFDDLDRFADLLHADSGMSAESAGLIRGLRRQYGSLMRGIIEAGIRDGTFASYDPTVMTFTSLRACLGVAVWDRPGGRLTPETIVDQVTEQVLAGVLGRDGAP